MTKNERVKEIMIMSQEEWWDKAINRGTSGDMVMDILSDWDKERKYLLSLLAEKEKNLLLREGMEKNCKTDKWDIRFLELAQFISKWSKDPSTKTGAVIVDDKRRVISVGYNGFARGVNDSLDRLENRDIKYKIIIHCERNALLFARSSVEGCTLYTYPFMSCSVCAAMVIQAGIKRCVAPYSDNERWQADFNLAKEMFSEAGVELNLIDYKS